MRFMTMFIIPYYSNNIDYSNDIDMSYNLGPGHGSKSQMIVHRPLTPT